MRSRRTVTITVDGEHYNARRLGKGKYSIVYKVGDRAVYYTRGDCSKEVLAMYNYGRVTHLPEIIRHGNIHTNRSMWYVFSSPIYANVTKKHKSAFELRRNIIEAYFSYRNDIEGHGFSLRGIYGMLNFVKYLRIYRPDIPKSISNALQVIVDVASNCGSDFVAFDFHKGNFGVNEYGTLIFRDPFHV